MAPVQGSPKISILRGHLLGMGCLVADFTAFSARSQEDRAQRGELRNVSWWRLGLAKPDTKTAGLRGARQLPAKPGQF